MSRGYISPPKPPVSSPGKEKQMIFLLIIVILITSVMQTVIDRAIGLHYKGTFQRVTHGVSMMLSGVLIAYIMFH